MKKIILLLLSFTVCLQNLHAQKIFQRIDLPGIPQNAYDFSSIIQDSRGYIWIAISGKGLLKYDGYKVNIYIHNDKDSNSIANNNLWTLAADHEGNIWIGLAGRGLDKFDPATNTFTHFRHKPNDPGSLVCDTVGAILEDHLGNLWVGTFRGLELYNKNTETFTHYSHRAADPTSLSGAEVNKLYEDKEGNLWVGCGWPIADARSGNTGGGLNLLNRTTGKFKRFLHDPADSGSIANNKVTAMQEDSKGNFWIGTGGDGLQILNRQTGKFIHYYYDSTHPDKLSRGPLSKFFPDYITFIREDVRGRIWIGTYAEGIVEYNSETNKAMHYGYIIKNVKTVKADTLTGFDDYFPHDALVSKDGLLWITTVGGNLYKINPYTNVVLPYTQTWYSTNAFYKALDGTLWIATDNGLIKRNTKSGMDKLFLHEQGNPNSLINNSVQDLLPEGNGNLLLATMSGFQKFNPATNQFSRYYSDTGHHSTIADGLFSLYLDSSKNLWMGTHGNGLIKMDVAGKLFYYKRDKRDSSNLVSNEVNSIAGNKSGIWVATFDGLDKLETRAGWFQHYLTGIPVYILLNDDKGIVWAGTRDGLFKYEPASNDFIHFTIPGIEIGHVICLNEDKNNNLWVSTTTNIIEINGDRKHARIFDETNGVHINNVVWEYDYINKDDEIFLGDDKGYYHFYTDSLQNEADTPAVYFASLQTGGKMIKGGKGSLLDSSISFIRKLKLPNNKNSFSIGFSVIDFLTTGEKKVVYMLENYDDQWHETSDDHTAYFYNLPAGHYVLRARGINAHGGWSEKTLSIIISPPWWQTWWAIALFIFGLIALVLCFSYYRSIQLRKKNKLLEEKVKQRTGQLQKSLEDLKSTQNQLIQSEKMASLGELTAGIAHEIQNPLNFVNNFSEVSNEMLDEMKEELATGNGQLAIEIADDVKQNLEKILHHGKRADAIVKGMLQHSRASSGKKEPTDINALCDEYLRLSYHGMRAKDKEFNAEFKTDFDNSIGKINIVAQDLGRVLLNLVNNAFYAVYERQRNAVNEQNASTSSAGQTGYQPTVSLSTKKSENSVIITVSDNGNGIPESIKEKIFQPFFTTKPTGSGTGLGLSLSYDIIKAHGGEIKVESKVDEGNPDNFGKGEGTTFTIQLPV